MVNSNCEISLKDSFREKIGILIRKGVVAGSSGRFLKLTVERLCHDYAAQLIDPRFPVSDLFLKIADKMMSGGLSRMPDEVFKVWLVISVYGLPETACNPNDAGLQADTGLGAEQLKRSLEYLEPSGYRASSGISEAKRTVTRKFYRQPPTRRRKQQKSL